MSLTDFLFSLLHDWQGFVTWFWFFMRKLLLSSFFSSDSPADLHGMWYPPLRRALLCLSKLYRSVDRSTFQGLSQVWEIVINLFFFFLKTDDFAIPCFRGVCFFFLFFRKFWRLPVRRLPMPRPKSWLIRQLWMRICSTLSICWSCANRSINPDLIKPPWQSLTCLFFFPLCWQIAPFQVDFAVKEMSLDFSSMKNAGKWQHFVDTTWIYFIYVLKCFLLSLSHSTALGLFQKKGRLFSLTASNALLEFLLEGAPQVREHLKGL